MADSLAFAHTEGTAAMNMRIRRFNHHRLGAGLSTRGCLPPNSVKTLVARLLSSPTVIPATRSYKMWAPDSISNAKDYSAFWTPSCLELSSKLWSPTEIGLQGSESTYSSISSSGAEPFLQSFEAMTLNPADLQNSQKTSYLSLQFSPPDSTAVANIAELTPEKALICKKIRIYPNAEQSKLFKQCLGGTRFFFNRANQYAKEQILQVNTARLSELKLLAENGCAQFFQSGSRKGEQCCGPLENEFFCSKHLKDPMGFKYDFMSLPSLRKAVLVANKDLAQCDIWQKKIPYDTRQLAIKSLIGCYESQFALKKIGLAPRVFVGFRNRKAPRQTFHVDSRAFNLSQLTIFKQILKEKAKLRIRKRDRKKIPAECADLTILWTKTGKWYICIPCPAKPQVAEPLCEPKNKSVFLDPGGRTFQTFYSPDGVCGKLGASYYKNNLLPLLKRVDALTSAAKHTGGNTMRNMRNRCCTLRTKVRNMVDDLHRKTCKFLCDSFSTIFIPPFQTQRMAAREGRQINNASVRALMTLAHYRFRKQLEDYASRRGVSVYVVSEAYTTITCGFCGQQNDVGASKIFRCAGCGLVADRDYAAARNICLRTATQCGN